MKKALCILLAFATLFLQSALITSALEPAAVSNESEDPHDIISLQLIQNGSFVSAEASSVADGSIVTIDRYLTDGSGTSDLDKAYNDIFDAIYNLEESVDISSYQLSSEEAHGLLQDLINHCPELFYINSYRALSSGAYVSSIEPIYDYPLDDIAQMKATYDAELKKITDLIDPDWSDIEKIVFVNDYLALNYTYDYMGLANGNDITDAYGFLTQKTGVCQAYTLTAIAILKPFGIKISSVSSPTINHIWNVVNLDGHWYHLDITWNDSYNNPRLVSDGESMFYQESPYFGAVSHEFMLLSDEAIYDDQHGMNGHHAWIADYTCDSYIYDDWFWRDARYPFAQANGEWYTVDPDTYKVVSCDFEAGVTEEEFEIDSVWYVWGSQSSHWTGSFSGIGSFEDKLYYNTDDTIYSYDPVTKQHTALEGEHDPEEGNVFGLYVFDNEVRYYTSTEPYNGEKTYYTLTLERTNPDPDPDPSASATVKGSVTVSNNLLTDMSVTLQENGEIRYTAALSLATGAQNISVDFLFEEVAAGRYDLVISKTGHVNYTVKGIPVSGSDIDLSEILASMVLPCGDISGDNYIDSTDVALLVFDLGKNNDSASYLNSDIDKDGYRDAKDVAVLSFYMLKAAVNIEFSAIENP